VEVVAGRLVVDCLSARALWTAVRLRVVLLLVPTTAGPCGAIDRHDEAMEGDGSDAFADCSDAHGSSAMGSASPTGTTPRDVTPSPSSYPAMEQSGSGVLRDGCATREWPAHVAAIGLAQPPLVAGWLGGSTPAAAYGRPSCAFELCANSGEDWAVPVGGGGGVATKVLVAQAAPDVQLRCPASLALIGVTCCPIDRGADAGPRGSDRGLRVWPSVGGVGSASSSAAVPSSGGVIALPSPEEEGTADGRGI